MSRRSDYFSTMLGSSFQEGSDAASSDMLELQMTDAEAFVVQAALRWVYTDRVDPDMPAEQLLQVCCTALCCAVLLPLSCSAMSHSMCEAYWLLH